MSKPFKSIINIDIRDSVPDWQPYEQPNVPKGAPNVRFVAWDDTGKGATSAFGGPIEMPTVQRLAHGGAPVTADYPNERPWPFTGGSIQRVIVDVSGEAYVDLELEAVGMMKRD